jgi:hypothetical protein
MASVISPVSVHVWENAKTGHTMKIIEVSY